MAQSKLSGSVPEGAKNTASVIDKQSSWAKLPPALRDELMQSQRDDVPERWRKRLEAYFVSIAKDEAKRTER